MAERCRPVAAAQIESIEEFLSAFISSRFFPFLTAVLVNTSPSLLSLTHR